MNVLEDIADAIRISGLSHSDLAGIIEHLNGLHRWNVKTIDTFVCRSISHAIWLAKQ